MDQNICEHYSDFSVRSPQAIRCDGPLLVCAFNRAGSVDQSRCAYYVDMSKQESTPAQVTMCDPSDGDLMLFRVQAHLEINVEMSHHKGRHRV